MRGRSYLVGPLARYSLNSNWLRPEVRAAAREAELGSACRNPFRSIVVRSLEILQACEEALEMIRALPAARQAIRGCRAASS